jgi:hypothetical protein
MKRTEKTEFEKGFKNGSAGYVAVYGISEAAMRAMMKDNLRKADQGIKDGEPLIRAYWSGYLEGVKSISE